LFRDIPKGGIPVVFDTHHFECYNQFHPNEDFKDPSEYMKPILASWGDIKPKFHVSEQVLEDVVIIVHL
jgi:UV DNA damage repair endonuclease